MTDYRLPANRGAYFTALYHMNLENRVMPGLVYLYMPALAARYGWDDEQKLWFAFLNGLTQNPLTSLVLMEQLPEVPTWSSIGVTGTALDRFGEWFNTNWDRLQFDTDRRYQKKDTPLAVRDYAWLVEQAGSQKHLLAGFEFKTLWRTASSFLSFGRLATFSYLEYVHLLGLGPDCDDLMFADKSGSRSHRNGMLLLLGHDEAVWDKRANNGHTGNYSDLKVLGANLAMVADRYLEIFRQEHPNTPDVGRFTLESNLCTFKNHFYGRRYPGVYADMAYERILKGEAAGWTAQARVLREIREEGLPAWLREEAGPDPRTLRERGSLFPETGVPYRGEWFL